MKFAQAFST